VAAAYREAFEAHDYAAIRDLLAPDAVLFSPITPSFQFHGQGQVADVLRDVNEVTDQLEITDLIGSGDTHALISQGSVGGESIGGVVVLRVEDERIRELTVYIRPLPGLATLTAKLGPPVARRRGRLHALLIWVMTAPLAFVLRVGDKLLAGLARPPGQP
jgi:hypothetical protein